MTPEQEQRVQLLVEALRSGKYKQGRSHLTQRLTGEKDYDCCLGVGCKVYMEQSGDTQFKATVKGGVIEYGKLRDKSTGSLPEVVRKWYGFREADGSFSEGVERHNGRSLVDLNDNGQSFKVIANVISSKAPGLFIDWRVRPLIRSSDGWTTRGGIWNIENYGGDGWQVTPTYVVEEIRASLRTKERFPTLKAAVEWIQAKAAEMEAKDASQSQGEVDGPQQSGGQDPSRGVDQAAE